MSGGLAQRVRIGSGTVGPGPWNSAVPERVGRMISFLLANAGRIATLDRIKITFHCAGKRIRTEMSESGET